MSDFGWHYPMGVSDASVSSPDPVECPLCLGEGEIDATPCCGSPYVETETGYQCFRCRETYPDNKCPDCKGHGVQTE